MESGPDSFHWLIQIDCALPNPERDVANEHSASDTNGPFAQHVVPTLGPFMCTSFPCLLEPPRTLYSSAQGCKGVTEYVRNKTLQMWPEKISHHFLGRDLDCVFVFTYFLTLLHP